MRNVLFATVAACGILAASIVPASAGAPVTAAGARDAIVLFYIQQKIYQPSVRCRDKEIDRQQFVFCTPPLGGEFGGLWAIIPQANGMGVAPVNGKALGHSRGTTSISAENGTAVPVVVAPQEIRNMSATAVAAFK